MFSDQIQPVAWRLPWMTVGGNHERDWPDSGDRYGNVMDSGASYPYCFLNPDSLCCSCHNLFPCDQRTPGLRLT